MADITITFNNGVNASLQTGDTLYFLNTGNIKECGAITDISEDRKTLTADIPDANIRPASGDFFMFGKNNVINTNGLPGYHATVTLTTESTEFAELYAVNSETSFSSN
jgi:hypothetical protein